MEGSSTLLTGKSRLAQVGTPSCSVLAAEAWLTMSRVVLLAAAFLTDSGRPERAS